MKYMKIIIILPTLAWAQDLEFQLQPEAFQVDIFGWHPYCAWAGGDAETSPECCDIDADGDLDLFLGNYWGWISQFENHGSTNLPDFQFIMRQYATVDLYGEPYYGRTDPVFIDIDEDGDLDLFTSCSRGLVHYWQNQGTAQMANFVWISDSLEYIDVPGRAHLDFVDLDGDGDFDLLIGANTGQIWFFRNIGTTAQFDFQLETSSLGSIDVGNTASPCFVDIDSDRDFDLFIGNSAGNLYYYRNDGDSSQYNFTFVSNNYLGQSVGQYASPEFADLDGDGDYDLLMGREPASGNLMGDVFYYENIGTAQAAQFQLVTRNYLMMDVGYFCATPQLVDINGDNAPDLIGAAQNSLFYFQNIGDSLNPNFQIMDEIFQGITRNGIFSSFGDIDGDGDYDLLAGEGAIPGPPTIALYTNRGTPTSPQLVLSNPAYITNQDFFVNANPGLADIDADGDLDLFVSDDHGHFFYYQNNGTPLVPNYTLVSSQWQGIQFYYPDFGWRGFHFGDLDDDQDLDLVMSNALYTNVRWYRNNGTAQVPNMSLVTDSLLTGQFVYHGSPYLIDIDLDDDLDLFVGGGNGGVLFFRNVTGEIPGVRPGRQSTPPYRGPVLSIGPNPANPLTVVSCQLPVASNISLEVFDISGKKVIELASGLHLPGEYRYVWDASPNASGMYIIRLNAPQQNISEKLVITK